MCNEYLLNCGMASRKVKTSGNRQHEKKRHDLGYNWLMTDLPVCQSKQKSKTKPEVQSVVKTTGINDLKSNCIERIFKYLDPSDLLNLADSTKLLREHAILTFMDKYAGNQVYFHSIRPSRHGWIRIDSEKRIAVDSLASCLRLLRCFGNIITDLKISFVDAAPTHCYRLNRYLNKYCSKSLINISLDSAAKNCLKQMIGNLDPLSNVEGLKFQRCDFDSSLNGLNNSFPQLKTLELLGWNEGFGSSIGQHFPCLENLTFDVVSYGLRQPITCLLRLNPQLQHLTLRNCNATFLQNVSKYLQLIESLEVCWAGDSSNIKCDRFYCHNVRRLTFGFEHGATEIPNIPLGFDRLEELTVDDSEDTYSEEFYLSGYHGAMDFDCTLSDHFLKFIAEQPYLNRLKMISHKIPKLDKMKLASVASSLEEVDLSSSEFSVEEVISFLSECKSLKQFHFKLADQSEYNTLQDRVNGKKWQTTIESGERVHMKRMNQKVISK